MKFCPFIFLFFLCSQLYARSLFEDAPREDSGVNSSENFELNGNVRGVLYTGISSENEAVEIKNSYAEASLGLRISMKSTGDGFAEIRYRRGSDFGENVSEVDIREAYVNLYIGPLDFRLGHQIVVWGRADGINPTDNITPKDLLIRSPDEDDRRKGNFLIRSYLNFQYFRFESIWIPVYNASELPTSLISLPDGMSFAEPEYPATLLRESSFALKLHLELASVDGSLSYFNGYNPVPGLDISNSDLAAKAYRMHIIGFDFVTILGSFGLRGEIAYRTPHKNYVNNIYVPNPDLQYILGSEREFGNFTILLQYAGNIVFDFTDLSEPENELERVQTEILRKNRMFASQQKKFGHSASFRLSWKTMYEILNTEVLGLLNFSTEELFVRPKASYRIADALTFTVGADIYSGPDDTLFGSMDSMLSSLFMELRASF